jgi:hypothetical protein
MYLLKIFAFLALARLNLAGPVPGDTGSAKIEARQNQIGSTFDTRSVYYLSNMYAGQSLVLSSEPSLSMQPLSTAPRGALWRLSPSDYPGYYRLQTLSASGKSLDVVNDRGAQSIGVAMANTGDDSGQLWRFDPWNDGTYGLSNMYTGAGKHLDVYSGTLQLYLGEGNLSGQHWYLTPV